MKSKTIRRYLLAGLLVWLPVMATLLVLRFIVDILDSTLALLPARFSPELLFGMHIPGFGVILSLLIVFATGVIATNFFGQKLVSFGEAILARIPLVRSIYNAVKQVLETLFSTNSQAFRRVLLVEYPRKGLWSIAFQTGKANHEVQNHIGEELITIFIPTTPNPTSGFLMMVPINDIVELDLTIDEALKTIISLGVVHPKPEACTSPKS